MKRFTDAYGDWGIVAGAAEGLGKAFSECLASRKVNVVLIDNNEEKLYKTSSDLEKAFQVRTKKLLIDLSRPEMISFLFEALEGLDCRLLIYNAAFGPVRSFLNNSPQELDYHMDLNSRMPLHLIYHFLKDIPEGKKAGVILMSSLAGLWGTQLVAPYGATKAFGWNLAESLHYEMKDRNIDVMACCAGATDTPNYRNTNPSYGLLKPFIEDPSHVAESAIKNLGKKALFIPGWRNRLMWLLLNNFMPRKWATGIMNRTMKRIYDKST